jgi:hypothetical protein
LRTAGISVHTAVTGSCREALDSHLAMGSTKHPGDGGRAGPPG